MVTSSIPSYGDPPITEVAFGVQFGQIPLQTRHIGQFWTEIKDEYPLTQDLPPTQDMVESPQILAMPPLRRSFFGDQSSEFVIQLQDSRFYYNWRKLSPDMQYPRFKVCFGKFLGAWGRFSDFLKRQNLPEPTPMKYELTYVNQIESLGPGRIEQAVKLFDWGNVHAEFLSTPKTTNIAWSFELPDSKGGMNVSTNPLTRTDGRRAVLLVLTCSGPSATEKYSLDDWFETAHEWIVRGFTDLTTTEAHQIWKKEK